MKAQQQAKDSGYPCTAGSQAHQGGIHGACRTAQGSADKGLKIAQVHAENGRLCDSHKAGQGRGKRHGFDFGVFGFQCNRQGCGALGKVGGRSQGQPVGKAVLGDLPHINYRVHMMDASHHGQGIKAAHHHASQAQGQGKQGQNPVDNPIFHSNEYRPNDRECQITGSKHTYQWCYEKIQHGRNHLVQTLFNKAEDPHGNNHRDDVSLVTHHIHMVKPEPYGLGPEHPFCCHCPCILQVGMNHNHTDDCTQKGIPAKSPGRAERNQNRQKGIGRIGKQVGKNIDRAGGIDIQKPVVDHKVESLHDSHEKTAGHNRRDNGDKNITQGFDCPLEQILFGGGCRLHLFL